ncbi:hypothetical protein GCM10009776_13210 [Microbacterium deminutum]|uniref:Uncharacterized protein n=1 Tax=Microbacterium deminutum TaxID=344164 RepID=A0ABP5BW18_9MICO
MSCIIAPGFNKSRESHAGKREMPALTFAERLIHGAQRDVAHHVDPEREAELTDSVRERPESASLARAGEPRFWSWTSPLTADSDPLSIFPASAKRAARRRRDFIHLGCRGLPRPVGWMVGPGPPTSMEAAMSDPTPPRGSRSGTIAWARAIGDRGERDAASSAA